MKHNEYALVFRLDLLNVQFGHGGAISQVSPAIARLF